MRSISRPNWLAGIIFLLPAALIAQQQFHGTLSDHLEIAANVSGFVHWKDVTPAERNSIPEPLTPADSVRVGDLSFAGGAVSYQGALVKKAAGPFELFVDANHAGHFTAADKHLFHPPMPGEDQTMSATTELTLPLDRGPYPSFPAVVSLLSPDAKIPASWTRPDFLLAGTPFVEGTVSLPGRTLTVRFAYALAKGTVDLENAAEWMDVDTPGKIDFYADRQVPQGKPPIFHVGSLYLAASAIDLQARTFTLISLPAGEYTRFDLAKGAILPDFTWTGFDGQSHKFSAITGQYRLIDFWATWCEPCVADLPSKKAAYEKYHARGFDMLSVDGDASDPGAAQKLIAKDQLPWPQARYDQHLVDKLFVVNSWPTMILVDRSGRIVATSEQDLEGGALDKTLAKLLPASSH
ncbi:MAG TPA: TlpA disulfide reductase family protein [Acidobacteriaceae bacterium]